ncbi:hypothetical protein TRICI_000228 [Trichomonascus ciferrii]|uniref:Vacuolar import/degradation Vid27 C-terminal domain-containing protein n=1 Tax=Trichomonascus ciferrii TaxID=44093 RepID=A0A642VE22_9ASCO|nr:hypothetical protein TRICI_000228 [Trichomonascus ciferrii]
MNFLRKFLASAPKEELVVIPSGELYLKRSPNSPKGVNECIFKDAVARIRKTTVDYQYQLVVERVYEEGEEDLEENEDNGSDLEEENEDEWVFLIDEALKICYGEKEGRVVICWKDLDGEPGDMFEFVCAKDTKAKIFEMFDFVSRKCQYERKYQEPFEGTEEDLEEFDFDQEVAVAEEEEQEQFSSPPTTPAKKTDAVPETPAKQTTTKNPQRESEIPEVTGDVICTQTASLHLFDAATGVFIEQAEDVDAKVIDLGGFEYWLGVDRKSNGRKVLGLPVGSDMNPCFNFEHLSFIFNYFSETGAFSWLLKFPSFEILEEFQQGLMQALWESANKQKWVKAPSDEREYLIDSFNQMDISEDADQQEDEEEEEEEEQEKPFGTNKTDTYDDDEEHDEVQNFDAKGKNSQLAVGIKNDRSYVVRGDKVGVFKQTPYDDLEFSTTIDNVSNLQGKNFAPGNVMLHTQDRTLVLQDPENEKKLYSMDLETGKVVDEWEIGQNVKSFGPSTKFSQMTPEQTLLGLAENGLFRIDPRLDKSKVVESEQKKYSTNNKFSSIASTENGYIAVASNNGDIRLYDRLGINAKTHIPAMGDPIISVDVSADGRWILATCKTYLLLIDTTIKEGKNAGSVGFLKSFGKDSKPRPKRLQISPEHVAFMQGETGKPLSFTNAHFNTGIDSKEQTIVTSSGPYVITWNLKKILRGDRDPYLIKRYAGQVTADNFKFGTDKNVIIALEDDVGMVNRRTFRKPTRESLATPAKRVQAMSRNSIVNSPY